MGATPGGLPTMASGVVGAAFDAVLQDENMVASSLSTAVRTMGTSLLQRVTQQCRKKYLTGSVRTSREVCKEYLQVIVTSESQKQVVGLLFMISD